MASPQGPSFIPKQPAQGNIKRRKVRKVYVLAYVSFVLFFGTLVASVGTFLYKVSIEAQLEREKENLAEQRQRFDESDIAQVQELSKRLTTAKQLLNAHVSPLRLIESLEDATVETVQLTSFALTQDQTTGITISLEARTEEFNSVLFQRSVVSANPVLSGASFESITGSKADVSGENSNDEQLVTFLITKDLAASDIPYVPRSTAQSAAVSNTVTNQSDIQNEVTAPDEDGDVVPSDEEADVLPPEETFQDDLITQ